jgi:hypothetical protein
MAYGARHRAAWSGTKVEVGLTGGWASALVAQRVARLMTIGQHHQGPMM